MKLLICTQKVDKNDSVLGFFHRWIEEFAKHCEKVTVICLEKGEYSLPNNVKVLSLGKEHGVSRLKYLFCFYTYIWKYRKEYDKVFVHMNPEYVVLGGLFWRLLRKKIALWYMHKSVNLKLRIAERVVHNIFTGTKESFRLKTNKLHITGHGIDTAAFSFSPKVVDKENLRFICVARLSPVKHTEDAVEFAGLLDKNGIGFEMTLIGTVLDEAYVNRLKSRVEELCLGKKVFFQKEVPPDQVQYYLAQNNIFIHTGNTGSLDKTVLEAVASGLYVFSANDASKNLLRSIGLGDFCYRLGDGKDLYHVFSKVLDKTFDQTVLKKQRRLVEEGHDLVNLIKRIVGGL